MSYNKCTNFSKTKPNQTKRNPTQPNPTKPNQTKPNPTKPNQTQPNQTKPNQNKPNPTQPNQTKTNPTKPNQTKPNQTKQIPQNCLYVAILFQFPRSVFVAPLICCKTLVMEAQLLFTLQLPLCLSYLWRDYFRPALWWVSDEAVWLKCDNWLVLEC